MADLTLTPEARENYAGLMTRVPAPDFVVQTPGVEAPGSGPDIGAGIKPPEPPQQ